MSELSGAARALIERAMVEDEPPAEALQQSWGTLLGRVGVGVGSETGATQARDASRDPSRDLASREMVVYEPGTSVGRYLVLDVLGHGAMGVVYCAFDPELQRNVALKVVNPGYGNGARAAEARARLVAEARSLARLSHPNVTAIYDAGQHHEQVYLAMELVQGRDLASWMSTGPHPWPEVLAMFVAAGRGLAEAHASGVVHRDFKPSNVLVGDDGRVRISDFGLARPERADSVDDTPDSGSLPPSTDLTATGVIMGTPAYMAPEQHAGQEVGPAADQFAFCVALHEALYGVRPFGGTVAQIAVAKHQPIEGPPSGPVPTWLWPVLVKGLAARPEDRFEDMVALLRSLSGVSASRRRRRAVAVATGVVLAGSLAAAYELGTSDPRSCRGFEERAASVWSERARDAGAEAFVASGRPYADDSWQRLESVLDERTAQWIAMAEDACEATHQRGDQSDQLLDLRMACLDQRMGEVSAVVGLVEHAEADVVDRASDLSRWLTPLQGCADLQALRSLIPPPSDPETRRQVASARTELTQVRALEAAGRYAVALQRLGAGQQNVESLGYPPLLAEFLALRGSVEDRVEDPAVSVPTLKQAVWTGQAAGHDRVVAEASAGLVWAVGERQGRFEAAVEWGQLADASLQRLGGNAVIRWRLLNALGSVHFNAARYDESLDFHRRGRALAVDSFGEASYEAGVSLANASNVYQALNQFDAALGHLHDALDTFRRVKGDRHPDLGRVHDNIGSILRLQGKASEAVRLHREAIAIQAGAFGEDHPNLVPTWTNLGSAYGSVGDSEQALAAFERALSIAEAHDLEGSNLATLLNNLGQELLRAGLPGADAHLERSIAVLERLYGPDYADLLFPLANLGRVRLDQGRVAEAEALHHRGVALARRHYGERNRTLGMSLSNLADAVASRGDAQQAVELYEEALSVYRAVEGLDPIEVAIAHAELGNVYLSIGRHAEAADNAERALVALDTRADDVKLRARAQFVWARALWALGQDRERALVLARSARDGHHSLGPRAQAEVEAVDRWLAARGARLPAISKPSG